MRRATVRFLGILTLSAIVATTIDAQEKINTPKPVEDKAKIEAKKDNVLPASGQADATGTIRKGLDAYPQRPSIEASGYTRPGNPADKILPDGNIVPASTFAAENLQKFKIMGGTVYFAVFKNTGIVEGDTFGTGMTNFDNRFLEGRSFTNSYSPRYDRRAKYLYLYQVVNDRAFDPRHRPQKKAGGELIFGVDQEVQALNKIPKTDDIASFALKLLVDPRYITSWGHFNGTGFASNVTDVDLAGRPVKTVALEDGQKIERDREIRMAVSFVPAITLKIPYPAYDGRARAYPLGPLSAGFGVDRAALNMTSTQAYKELVQVSTKLEEGKIKVAALNTAMAATKKANEPDFVQLMYLASEERLPDSDPALMTDDEITRAIFRADWRNDLLKEGEQSVVFGFTTDLPPANAPIRIDTPGAALRSEGLRLASYFADSPVVRATGTVSRASEGIAQAAAGLDAGALSLALGTALGQAATPAPAPGESGAAAGFAGISGGVGGLGGGVGGGIGGVPLGFPPIGSIGRAGGAATSGGGGSQGSGSNTGTGTTTGNGNTNGNSNTPSINFNASLTNQAIAAAIAAQQQQQQQSQSQSQNQHQNNGHGNHGHVVPAPATLLLALLGLPGLLFWRRRKTEETTSEPTV